MGSLRYSINITLDGCCDHAGGTPDEELHLYWTDVIAQSDAVLYGRITYKLMEDGWRNIAETGVKPDGMPDWMVPFAKAIHPIRKYVVSKTLADVDWNAELIRGDLEQSIRQIKQQVSGRIALGGVALPLSLAKLDLIDEYEFVVHPTVAGRGPTLLAGLPTPLDLKLMNRREFGSGAVALLYEKAR